MKETIEGVSSSEALGLRVNAEAANVHVVEVSYENNGEFIDLAPFQSLDFHYNI